MSEELHRKLVAFLSGEFARQEGRQCVSLTLYYAQPGFREEELRSWVRTEQPELFSNFTKVEELASAIIEATEGHVDAFSMGAQRYVVKTLQHLQGRAQLAFKLSPSSLANGEDMTGLQLSGGGKGSGVAEAMGVVTQNNMALLRSNTQLFQSAFGTLAKVNDDLREDNAKLHARVAVLENENSTLKMDQTEREFSIAMKMEQNQRASKGFDKMIQLGTIVAAKMVGSGDDKNGPSGLTMLLSSFAKSLRPEQTSSLMTMLDGDQKLLFFEIMNTVSAAESAGNTTPGTNGKPPNGAAAASPKAAS